MREVKTFMSRLRADCRGAGYVGDGVSSRPEARWAHRLARTDAGEATPLAVRSGSSQERARRAEVMIGTGWHLLRAVLQSDQAGPRLRFDGSETVGRI